MEKDILETFVTLANVQNISKTAQVLYISQAAVSHRLKTGGTYRGRIDYS